MKYKIALRFLDVLLDTAINLAYAGVVATVGKGLVAVLDQDISWLSAYGFTVLVVYLDLLVVRPKRKKK